MPRQKKTPSSKANKVDKISLFDLDLISKTLRKSVIEMLVQAKSGHSAGPLGLADVFTVLYFHSLNINPEKPNDPNRDRFVLSAGHLCPILYAALAEKGFFEKKHLKTLRKLNSILQGHTHVGTTPGVENTSGPLGQGLSVAIGMALAAKLDKKSHRIICLGSDGELNEGQIWEASMFATKNRLNNLTWIIDRNNIQIDGYTEDIMPLEPLRDKLESFGWYVIEIDGHNFEEIIGALNMAKAIFERPTAIITHTIPGYGVDFMEYKFEWHGKTPSKEQAQAALKQLRSLNGRIVSDYD